MTSISLLAKAVASPEESRTRKVTLSSLGAAPHHLSLGTRVAIWAASSQESTLNGPEK